MLSPAEQLIIQELVETRKARDAYLQHLEASQQENARLREQLEQ